MARAKKRRESALEARCVRWARAAGVVVVKLTLLDGIPDRIFFVPGGRPLLVEFKARGEVPEELQSWYLRALKKAGYSASYCDSWEEFQQLWQQTVTLKTKRSRT